MPQSSPPAGSKGKFARLSRRRAEDQCTGVYGYDRSKARDALACIKRRISRAITSEFGNDTAAVQWMHKIKRQYLASLRRLQSVRNEPDGPSGAFNAHYRAYSTRMVNALCAFKKKDPSHFAARMREIEEAAMQMDVGTRVIPTWTSVNFGGSSRTVHSFDIVDYARQLTVSDFISCVGPSPHNDFAAPGAGGVGAHIRHVRQLVANGHNHFLAVDIRRAFPSVRPHDVEQLLSIPQWVMENIIFSEDARVVLLHTGTTIRRPDPNASCGLPQGSVCSGSAWSMVAGSILRPLAGDRWDISHYVDDVLASARSRPELEHLYRQMEEGFHRRSCGRLRFGKVQLVDLRRQPLDFLGYRVSLLAERQLWVRPSPSGWKKAEQRCWELLEDIYYDSAVPDPLELLERAEGYFRQWISSHPEWQPSDPGLKERLMIQHTSDVWHRFCWEHDVQMPD